MNSRESLISASLACAGALVFGCKPSSSGPEPGDTGCTVTDASILTSLSVDSGSPACQSCITGSCSGVLANCSTDCTCNSTALEALSCIGGLPGSATASSLASCVSNLTGSSDGTLLRVGTCLVSCGQACTAGASDGSPGGPADGCAADATVTTYLSDAGACAACLQSTCGRPGEPLAKCAGDCMCNATVVEAVQCLAGLGASAAVVSTTACVAPVLTSTDPELLAVGECLANGCAQACGLSSEAGAPDAEAGAEAGEAGSSACIPIPHGTMNDIEVSSAGVWLPAYSEEDGPQLSAVDLVSPAGVVVQYVMPPNLRVLSSMHAAPDGSVWFVVEDTGRIAPPALGHMTADGIFTQITVPQGAANSTGGVVDVVVTSDGAVWFADTEVDPPADAGANPTPAFHIGKMDTGGTFTQYGLPNQIVLVAAGPVYVGTAPYIGNLYNMGLGPGGSIWVSASEEATVPGGVAENPTLINVTRSGALTTYLLEMVNPAQTEIPTNLLAGPDGNLWFVGIEGSLATMTAGRTVTTYTAPYSTEDGGAYWDETPSITVGPDGNLWMPFYYDQPAAAGGGAYLARITTTGAFGAPVRLLAGAHGIGNVKTSSDGRIWAPVQIEPAGGGYAVVLCSYVVP